MTQTTDRNQLALDELHECFWTDTNVVDGGIKLHSEKKASEFLTKNFTVLQAALTAQTVTDDGVSEVHEYLTGKYFIVKNGLYYRPEAKGYTVEPNSAGLYSHAEAMEHLKGCSELSIKPAYRIRAATAPKCDVINDIEKLSSRLNSLPVGDLRTSLSRVAISLSNFLGNHRAQQ